MPAIASRRPVPFFGSLRASNPSNASQLARGGKTALHDSNLSSCTVDSTPPLRGLDLSTGAHATKKRLLPRFRSDRHLVRRATRSTSQPFLSSERQLVLTSSDKNGMTEQESAVGRGILESIAGVIARDRGCPGIRGRVDLGVRDAHGELWLSADLGARASASLSSTASAAADVSMLMGEPEFRTLVQTGAAPQNPGLAQLSGNVDLLVRFLERYLIKQSVIALRTRRSDARVKSAGHHETKKTSRTRGRQP